MLIIIVLIIISNRLKLFTSSPYSSMPLFSKLRISRLNIVSSRLYNSDKGLDFFDSKESLHGESNKKRQNLSNPIMVATENVPLIIFSSQKVELDCLEQLKGLAKSVIPVGYVSAMPDVHLGKGSTIGTVFASESYVSPNAVGVDIGCGMTAIPMAGLFKSSLTEEIKKNIHAAIKKSVPTGFNSFTSIQPNVDETLRNICSEIKPTKWLAENILPLDKTKLQLGTLGGGNHFIEVVFDESDQVWVMLHSGSRYVGKTTAEHHNAVALEEMKAQKIKDHPPGLAYLHIEVVYLLITLFIQ